MLSPQLTKEILYSNFNKIDLTVGDLTDSCWQTLFSSLKKWLTDPPNEPMLFYNNNKVIDFYLFNLNHLKYTTFQSVSTLNEAIDRFYTFKIKQVKYENYLSSLTKLLNKQIKKINKKLKLLQKDLKKSEK